MRERLVITGMGAVTPIGLGVEEYWNNLIQGKCGIGPITRFDASKLPTQISAEISGFDERYNIPSQIARSSSLFMRYAFAAAEEALHNAKFIPEGNNQKIGICMGTALAGSEEIATASENWINSNTGKISPHLVPKTIANIAAAHLAINWQLHGPGLTLCTACSAGSDAVMTAAMLLLAGEADAIVVMAGESAITPTIVSSLAQAKALSRRNDSPQTASRPFEKDRDGFVIGEGGGAIILETEKHALDRGAKIYAELSGWANNLDGYHITAPEPNGTGAAACMASALKKANLKPDQIDYINLHGTATILGDIAETKAIKKVFDKNTPPASSTKGATGHLMGAGGLTELIACVLSIRENIIPPTLNLFSKDPDCDLDYVPLVSRKAQVKHAMTNSLGFGGQNSSLIVSHYHQGM